MKKLIIAVLLTLGYGEFAVAQKPKVIVNDMSGWHKIGETTVDYETEKDEIIVLGADAFKAIKIKITEAPIHLVSMVISFESGDNQEVNLEKSLNAGEESEVIQLNGGERRLKKVTYIYKTVSNSNDEKAEVELYGMK